MGGRWDGGFAGGSFRSSIQLMVFTSIKERLLSTIQFIILGKITAHFTDLLVVINKEDYKNAKKFGLRSKNGKVSDPRDRSGSGTVFPAFYRKGAQGKAKEAWNYRR